MGFQSLKPWIRERFHILKQEFGDKEFTSEQVGEILLKYEKPLENINEFLLILSKEGLITSRREGKTFYYRIVRDFPLEVSSIRKDELIKLLKTAADLIRGGVDYRVLLVLLFYKAMSDKWKTIAEKYYREFKDWKKAYHFTNIEYYFLYDEDNDELLTWDVVTKNKAELVQNFIRALNKVAELNPQISDLKILVQKLGFSGFLDNEDNFVIFRDVVEVFNKADFSKVNYDAVGAAYEWILWYFAQAQAKAGENYTPREVIRLIVEILDVEANKDVLDPACGSGAMLIEACRYVSEKYKDGETLKLLGQELNDITAILSKINLLLHGIKNFEIYTGDSLRNPKFDKANYVIANPPWNLDIRDPSAFTREDLRKIYEFGTTPKQSADWLWIQLMLHFAKEKVGIVIDNGALFRGGKEKKIREQIIEKRDYLECVILLPEKLFYNTGAPGAIMIFNKNKPEDRKNKILFINASQEYEKHPEVRRLNILGRKNINKIVKAYREFKNIEGFAKVVPIEKIRENDYNLNVTLYVYPKEEWEEIDVEKEWKELKKIEEELGEVEKRIEGYLREVRVVG